MTDKIVYRVSVVGSPHSAFSEPSPDDPPHEMHGSYYRNGARGRWMRRVHQEIDVDGKSLADSIAAMADVGGGLTNPRLSVDHDYDGAPYGDGCLYSVSVIGDRRATDEEIRWIRWQEKYNAARDREWQDRQIEQLKATRPELFKEDK